MTRNNKTSSVLRLVGADKNNQNPLMNTKQEQKPPEPPNIVETLPVRKKRPRKTVTKNLKITKLVTEAPLNPTIKQIGTEEQPIYRRIGNEKQIINISFFLINEQLGSILERFNSCTCDDCCRIISEKALKLMPVKFVHVNKKADADEVNACLKELRPEATRILTKLCLTARTKPYHDL